MRGLKHCQIIMREKEVEEEKEGSEEGRGKENNEEKVRVLVGFLAKHLFTSAQVVAVLETTPSVKTRLHMAVHQ